MFFGCSLHLLAGLLCKLCESKFIFAFYVYLPVYGDNSIVTILHIKLCTVSVIFVCYVAADLGGIVK